MENIIDTICAKADEASIRQAGQILKRGGLVAFPTETVYGLGADAVSYTHLTLPTNQRV